MADTRGGASSTIPEAGGDSAPVLSNRLTALADEARASFGEYEERERAALGTYRVAFGSYMETAARLAEARGLAKRGEWSPFLRRAGMPGRTARNLLLLHRGGWTAEDLANVGGVRAALEVESWRARAARGGNEVPAGNAGAVEALRSGPSSFVEWCEAEGEAPGSIVAGFKAAALPVAGDGDGEKTATWPLSGAGDKAPRNAGEGKWNPLRPSSNEWYSPGWIVEPAREVMGGIDLDPASCEEANGTIRADRYFTANDDGLAQPWTGRVWLNPPYSDRDLIRWVSKLVDAADSGAVPEAVMLLPAYTETRMGQAALARCDAVAFPASRVQFNRPGLPATNPPAASMVLYFGPRPVRFAAAYSERGLVLPGGRWAAWPEAA